MRQDRIPTFDEFQKLKEKSFLPADFVPPNQPQALEPQPEMMNASMESEMDETVDEMPGIQPKLPMATIVPPPNYVATPEYKAAIRQAGEIGKAQGDLEAEALIQQNRAQEEQMAAYQAERMSKEQDIALKEAEYLAKKEEVDNLKIDPNKYWAEKSTGEKILAGISLALGAYGAGFNGGINRAAEVIQGQIKRDIDTQAANIDNKRQGLKESSGLLASLRSSLGDKDLANQAALSHGYKMAARETEALGARARGEQQKANANVLVAELNQKASQADEAFKQRAGMLVSMQSNPMNPQMMGEKELARFVPGMGLALDKEAAKTLREANVSVKNGVDSISGLLAISNKPGKSLSFEDKKEALVLATSLKAAMRNELIGPGAVSESEWKLLDSIVANPTNILSLDSSNEIALKTLGKKLEKNLATKAQSYLVPQMNQVGGGVRTFKPGQKVDDKESKGSYQIVK